MASDILWRTVNDGHPEVRQPVLLCEAGVQAAVVGWFDGSLFCRWDGGGVAMTFHPTHWAPISWPQDPSPVATWQDAFETWEQTGRAPPPIRLFKSEVAAIEDHIERLTKQLNRIRQAAGSVRTEQNSGVVEREASNIYVDAGRALDSLSAIGAVVQTPR